MDTGRLRTGELIAAAAGVLLFIVMFLPWFGFDVGGAASDVAEDFGVALPDVDQSVNFNAWESFDFIDLVLLLTVIVAVGLGVMAAMAQTVNLPVAASALTAGLGILSTVLVLYRVIDPVGEAGRKFWLWVGLVLCAAIAYGGWRSMQEEGTTFGGEADRLGGDEPPAPPPPPPPNP